MSCVFLGNSHYTYLIDSLNMLAEQPLIKEFFIPLRKKHLGNSSLIERIEFGQRLLDANQQAYAARYPRQADIDIASMVFTLDRYDASHGLAAWLKALQCYDYQCCESTAWRAHPISVEYVTPMMDAFASASAALGIKDLNDTEEYNNAKWCI